MATGAAPNVLWRLYLSHSLSMWNSRMFEFGAVIFLAAIFPGTLFYASCYALFRAGAAALLSSSVGHMVDRVNRLRLIRSSIVWQRLPVAASCLAFLILLTYSTSEAVNITAFLVTVLLACFEKLASVGNTVAVERDWVIVISNHLGAAREDLNASMRRIDLVCKLVAPLFISLVDAHSTRVAILTVLVINLISAMIEYFAIAQVYHAIPELSHTRVSAESTSNVEVGIPSPLSSAPSFSRVRQYLLIIWGLLNPWPDYIRNPNFLASFSLSLLYLTVLSTGVQMATYLFALGFTSLEVSGMRLAGVVLELLATCAAPVLMKKIGAVRSGLWFINEQLICVSSAAAVFLFLNEGTKFGGLSLITGVTFSRVGLWGFDLSVQYLVQEGTSEFSRGRFSASEMALQNLFELISFATTVIFPEPKQFKYPVMVSCGAVLVSAVCFAAFVRQKRGHLLHASKCLKPKKDRYVEVPQIELDDRIGSHGRDV